MKKLSTNIKGLDAIFHGGIQLEKLTTSNKDTKKERLVIVIKGAKGTGKPNLAMQLMHGLTKSMQIYKKGIPPKMLFYSINKKSEDLNDRYLDILINRQIDSMIVDYRKDLLRAKEQDMNPVVPLEGKYAILDFLFDLSNTKIEYTYSEARNRLARIRERLPLLVCEGIVNYNHRTNSLHFKRRYDGDDWHNYIAGRRCDTIQDYMSILKAAEYNNSDGSLSCFYQDFVDCSFNDHAKGGKHTAKEKDSNRFEYYSKSPMTKYQDIMDDLDSKIMEKEGKDKEQDPDASKSVCDAIVIDGFSQLSTEELKQLPYSHILKVVRNVAKVAILVFDDRPEAQCDGDIVIEMRKSTAENEEYMYHELQISKSVFQTVAYGWHQYKMRDFGIEVFPSLHLLLSKRYYLQNKSRDIGRHLFDNNFEQYLDAINHRMPQCSQESCLQEVFFYQYLQKRNSDYVKLLKDVFSNQKQQIQEYTKNEKNHSHTNRKILTDTLFLNPNDNIQGTLAWEDHFKTTAIIGNPNSYKRYLALAASYYWAARKQHTLFILFDKNEMDMRRQMACPAFCNPDKKNDSSYIPCCTCSKYIHTFDLRMGCISAEDFFAKLLEQISLYCRSDEKTGIETSVLHIVIDDIQKIDYSFPFLKSTSLFLSTLISICHRHSVRLTILCDKNASLVKELCSLADTVVCVKRDESEKYLYSIELYIERGTNADVPSRIMKFHIKNIFRLFQCKSNSKESKSPSLHLAKERFTAQPIGSMKEYWRQTENIVYKK